MIESANTLTEKLSQPKTAEALLLFIDGLAKLHEAGSLESFMNAVQKVSAMDVAAVEASAGQDAAMADVKNVISFMSNSVTEKMVERNAVMMGELLNIADESADPCMVDALRDFKRLQKSGNLKTLVEASDMLAVVTNAVTDGMVQRIASLLAAVVEEMAAPHMMDGLKGMTTCLAKTMKEFTTAPPKPGIKSLMHIMRDPEVQMGMMFMAMMAKNMRNCMIDAYSGETNA